MIHRRHLLALAATASALGAREALAQLRELFVVTYPGSVDEGFKQVIGPEARRRLSLAPTFTPLLNAELIGRLQASAGAAPFDVGMWDNGPLVVAKDAGLLEPIPASAIPNAANLPPALRDPDGFGPAYTITTIGIAYNPKRGAAPTSWNDFWRPQNRGRVGVVGPASNLGTAFLVEIAKLRGGSETNVEPGFEALRQLIPNLSAIPANPGALSTAFAQGQIEMAPMYFNNYAVLKARGVDIAFAIPDTGLQIQTVTLSLIKGSRNSEAAARYINMMLDPAIQRLLEVAPWTQFPALPGVPLTGLNAELASSLDDLLRKGSFLNWASFIRNRPQWIERFNREIRV
jgi:putative spermidine/putrescine transport system substrate-binding protein